MSETKHLKLYKHDEPLESNENAFDIDKALNKNWDKVDENSEAIEKDISNIKDEQKKLNEDIESNKTINEENSNSINAVLNAMPTAKGEGEQVTLENTIDFKFKKFKVKGNSKQETRSGKNAIIGIYGSVGTNQINYSIDASVLTSNIMYFSLISSVALQTTNRVYIKDGNTVIANKGAITVNANSKAIIKINLTDEELTKIKSATNLILQLYENNTNIDYTKVTFSEVMLSSNSDSNYEKYGATPSLEFLSEIQNVDGNIKIKITNENNNKQKTILFPLAENQKLMKDDYLAEDGIHHKRKQIVLDGTENCFIGTELTNTCSFGLVVDNKTNGAGLCNSFITKDTGISSIDEEFVQTNNSNKIIYIRINKERLTSKDVQGLKTFLSSQKEAGTPVVVEYELAEEEVEIYTEEQQKKYEQIKNAKSYDGQTNIYCDNETSAIIEAEAYANINSIINNLQAQIISNASEGV